MKNKTPSLFRRVNLTVDRGKAKYCLICYKKFEFSLKEHQCKRCKRAVCSYCAPGQGMTFTSTGQLEKSLHRQCKICIEESEQIKKFVDQNHIKFLQDTKSTEWMAQFNITKEQAKSEYLQAQSKIAQSDQSEVRKLRNNLNVAFAEIPGAFNYSLREFAYYVIQDKEYEILKQSTGRILETFLSVYPEVGYSSDLIMLTIFFLCFASEGSAFSLLTIFFSEMVPGNLYPLNITNFDNSEDIDRVLQVLTSSFKMTQTDQPLIKQFLKQKLIRYQQCFTINLLQFETTFYIIDQLYQLHQNAQDEFIKCIASAISQNIAETKPNSINNEEIEIILLRNVKQTMIQEGYFKTKKVQFAPSKSFSRSQITSRFQSVVQETTQSTMEFDRVQILTKIIDEQKDQISKLSNQMTVSAGSPQRKKTIQYNLKDQSSIIADIKQVEEEDIVFQNLRKKTQHLIVEGEVDEDMATLTDYISKLEEVLILKHRQVKEQSIKINELSGTYDKYQQEINKLIKDVELSEQKYLEQTKLTLQAEKQASETKRIVDEQNKKMKELQDLVYASQQELNKSKLANLELKALDGSVQAVENFKVTQLSKECTRLQDENQKQLKKINELEVLLMEYNQKSTEQNETKKLQIQITQFEQKIFILNAQLSQREITITQQQKQIEQLILEGTQKSEGEQIAQERKKNAEFQIQLSSLQAGERIWKQKYEDVERQLKEQKIINQELKVKSGISNLNKDEQQRNNEQMQEQLMSGLEAKSKLTKQLLLQIEQLNQQLEKEKTLSQKLQIDYDQLIEQTSVRQNRAQTIQQQNQQKDQRIQDFGSQIEQLQVELSKTKSQYQQLAQLHQQLQESHKKIEFKLVDLEHQNKQQERIIQEKNDNINSYENRIKELNQQKQFIDEQLSESLKKQSEYKTSYDNMSFQVGNKGKEFESLKLKIEEQELTILGLREKFQQVKQSNEVGQNEKSILGTEAENLKKQLDMKDQQIKSKQEQIQSLNEQIKSLNDKISYQEQQRLLIERQIKNVEESLRSKEREYMSEGSRITTERDMARQRVIEAEAQVLKLSQVEKKLKNDLSNQNEEIQQLLLTQEQLSKQLKDYESSNNSIRETNLESNKTLTIKLEKLEQQNQNMNIKVDSQQLEIKSYIAKIEEQLTAITELKYKVQEEESVRKTKEKQLNDKLQVISQLEIQLVKVSEKLNSSQKQQQEVQDSYDELKQRHDIDMSNVQVLQSKSLEYNQMQSKLNEQNTKISQLEKQLLDHNEIQNQFNKQKRELSNLTDLLDTKLATIVEHEQKIIDLTNQLKEATTQLQQVRKENSEIMQKRAQDMQAMAQLKQIEVENGELQTKVYQQEATIQKQEQMVNMFKNQQLANEQSIMRTKVDLEHTEELLNQKIAEFDEKVRLMNALQQKYDQVNYRQQQFEENLRQIEDQRDDYQSKFELAEQQLDMLKGKDKEFSQLATNKVELQEQIHQLQKKNKSLERELQNQQGTISQREQDISQLQHTIQKKEQSIVQLEEAIIKLKGELVQTQRNYDNLRSEFQEMNADQASAAEIFVQVKSLTAENLSKAQQITLMKTQINELQEKNKSLEKSLNKLRSDMLVGNPTNIDSNELKFRVEDLESQLRQLQSINKTKDTQIIELRQLLQQQDIQSASTPKQAIKEVVKEIIIEKPVKNNNNQNGKIEEYQFIIEQQNEQIEKLKKNQSGLGDELNELLTQIISVFLKKKLKKEQLNVTNVLEQIKQFQKENKALTIREEDDDNQVLQKLQQYKGDYINLRWRIEQIVTKINILKEQMLQIISDVQVKSKKNNVDKSMEPSNIILYIKMLLESQAVQIINLTSQQGVIEKELNSFRNNTSPQGLIIQQVKELLQKAPYLTQQQIYQFTEPKVQIKLRKDHDQEDARLLLEARNQQIAWLKSLINEKQDQLAMMNTYLSKLKELMDKYHLK